MMSTPRKAKPTRDSVIRRAHKAMPSAQALKHWIDNQTAGNIGKTLREHIDVVIDSLEGIWLESIDPENPTPGEGTEKL